MNYLAKVLFQYLIPFTILVSCHKTVEYKDEIYAKPEIVKEAPSDFLSPEESLKKFYYPKGFNIELVASEPMVYEPVAIAWDGDGKMYVAQMNTYMQNVDGTGEDEPVCNIKLLIDTDGDGKIDKETTFIDSLVLPRMILPLDDRLLVNETYSYDIYSYRDTDGDGVADEKTLVISNPNRRGGNLEHQQSGLIWNLDNWIYMTTLPVRFRFKGGEVITDTLENYPGGQWGLTQDELGHMYYSSAGGENPAYGFQQPAVYGYFNPPGRLSEGFIEPWPVVGNPDVQGGIERRNRPDGTLNNFTGVAGQEIFKGDKLPPSLYGDLFIPEPVGRLIRRAKVVNEDGKKVLYNAYDKAEFIASTDLNFRPVQAQTGPDGCLYIVDMYRGIIQESAWTREGSHIRPVILRKDLDKNFGRGRIYRVTHEQIEPGETPQLLSKSAAELVPYLGHSNGWYRNTAQKLIVLKNDKSIIPELKEMALNNVPFYADWVQEKDYAIGRVHALWTLEGLGVIDENLLEKKLKDEDPRVRITALRLSEELMKEGNHNIVKNMVSLKNDSSINVVNQLALSLRYSDAPESSEILASLNEDYKENEIVSKSVYESLKKDDSELQKLKNKIAGENGGYKNRVLAGYDTYKQLCITCHGVDLKGTPAGDDATIAPTLIGSPRVTGDPDVLIKILLHGMQGPVDGKDYGIMLPQGSNDNNWIANIASYVRAMNDTTIIGGGDVNKIRREYADRETSWTIKELMK